MGGKYEIRAFDAYDGSDITPLGGKLTYSRYFESWFAMRKELRKVKKKYKTVLLTIHKTIKSYQGE